MTPLEAAARLRAREASCIERDRAEPPFVDDAMSQPCAPIVADALPQKLTVLSLACVDPTPADLRRIRDVTDEACAILDALGGPAVAGREANPIVTGLLALEADPRSAKVLAELTEMDRAESDPVRAAMAAHGRAVVDLGAIRQQFEALPAYGSEERSAVRLKMSEAEARMHATRRAVTMLCLDAYRIECERDNARDERQAKGVELG